MDRDAGEIEKYAGWFCKCPLNFGNIPALGNEGPLSSLHLTGIN